MTPRRLDRPRTAYRIGDPHGEFSIFDATGSTIYPGCWNDADTPVIYASEHYSTAMLEKLAHANGLMPPDQHFIQISLPHGLDYEIVSPEHLPDWAAPDCGSAREYGVQWAAEKRTAVLFVPSFVARIEPRETLIYSRARARDRFWSSGKARCRFGSRSYRAGSATPPGTKTGRALRVGPHFSRMLCCAA
ncbi:RES domain-containing protein [Methylonatrum kenyense]|uniref:RES family NAD+ phosphorylase n=1 Tax=Methylonatrum kenyense TaxID=455253 RepID=UPI0020BD4D7B|nr:RES domain-containing protein [Methylonatrum kenyense]MCK8515006.1 RES domain-containing protein [Methylonatrum kenyense]